MRDRGLLLALQTKFKGNNVAVARLAGPEAKALGISKTFFSSLRIRSLLPLDRFQRQESFWL